MQGFKSLQPLRGLRGLLGFVSNMLVNVRFYQVVKCLQFLTFFSIFQSVGWGCNAASHEKTRGILRAGAGAGCFLVFAALRSLWGFCVALCWLGFFEFYHALVISLQFPTSPATN